MAGSDYVTQADLEARYPATHVRRVFSDDGSGTAGDRLARSITVASRRADSILMRSNWSEEQIEQAVAEDELLRDAICDLVMAHGTKGKPEWSGQDRPYSGLEKSALQVLKDIAAAQLHSRAEDVVGKISTRNRQTHVPREKMFAGTRACPKPGGY